MKITPIALLLILILGISACDDQSNFFGGPQYDVEGNLAIDIPKIDAFLATADYDSLYRIYDPTGVVIIVQEEGTGSRPQFGNVIYSNYVGSLLDGPVFDTNLEEVAKENDIFDEERTYRIFQFVLGQPRNQGGVIDGFNIGYRRLRSGSKAVIIIPSPFAYQDAANNEVIPPNSILVFEVDFLGMD